MNLDLYFTLYRKINSRWTVDLHVKGKTIKLLQGNTREHLRDLGVGEVFLHKTQNVLTIKEKEIDKLNFIKTRTFSLSNDTIKRVNISHRMGEAIDSI